MERLRINEAIAYNEMQGKKIVKKDLALLLFPESSEESAQVSFNCLRTGKTTRIKVEWITKLCKALDVKPNQLLGYESF